MIVYPHRLMQKCILDQEKQIFIGPYANFQHIRLSHFGGISLPLGFHCFISSYFQNLKTFKNYYHMIKKDFMTF